VKNFASKTFPLIVLSKEFLSTPWAKIGYEEIFEIQKYFSGPRPAYCIWITYPFPGIRQKELVFQDPVAGNLLPIS